MHYILGTLAYATPWNMFLAASIVVKLMVLIMIVAGLVVAIAALVRKLGGGNRSPLLSVMSIVALVAGGLAVVYTGCINFIIYQEMRPTHLGVLLPSLIEIVYVLILAIIIWSIAEWGNAGAHQP